MNYLVIPDLQIPFEHQRALKFCKQLQKEYKISNDGILCVGDEVDNLHGGIYPKDPDGIFSAQGEIKATKYKIAEWAAAFPKMKIATSNHGMRWFKKAALAEIPSQMIRDYREVLGMPDTWLFQNQWVFRGKFPFGMIHGMGYSGPMAHRSLAINKGMSMIMGHLHNNAGVEYIHTGIKRIWGAASSSLIDYDSYAFKYGLDSKFKPPLGALVILDDGKKAVSEPL